MGENMTTAWIIGASHAHVDSRAAFDRRTTNVKMIVSNAGIVSDASWGAALRLHHHRRSRVRTISPTDRQLF